MEKRLQLDSSVREEIVRVWAIAWPLILTNILNALVGLVDFKMVGVLGVESIAAVGMSRQVTMFILVLMIAISGGASVLVAHAHGAGDRDKVGSIAGRSTMYMLYTAILVVTPLGLLTSRGILVALGAADPVVILGVSYLKVFFAGGVFTMFNFALSGILLGVGKTKVSLVLLVGVNLANIGLNYMFIFGAGPIPAYGVQGAAMGTIAARGIGSLIGIWILKSPRFLINIKFKKGLGFDPDLMKKIFRLGGPRSLQGIVRNFSRLMTIRVITLLPNAMPSVSAYSVGMQVRMISSFVGLAFMSAAMARVGQNMGKKDPEMAERSGWIAAVMALVIMTIFAVAFLTIPSRIMAFFTDDVGVIRLGRIFFITIAVTEPLMAFSFAMGGALRGGGEAMPPFIYSSVSDLVVVIVAGYILAVPLGMGFAGIALGMAISAVTRAIPTTLRFKKGLWKRIAL
jgi:putative MATE family efflux protein